MSVRSLVLTAFDRWASTGSSVDLVKDRDPGSSEQLFRSGERSPGRSESLTYPDQESLGVIGVGEALFPRPSDPPARRGDDKGQSPLVFGQTRNPVASDDLFAERLLLAIAILALPIVMFIGLTIEWPTP